MWQPQSGEEVVVWDQGGSRGGLLEGLDPLPSPLQPFCPRDLRMGFSWELAGGSTNSGGPPPRLASPELRLAEADSERWSRPVILLAPSEQVPQGAGTVVRVATSSALRLVLATSWGNRVSPPSVPERGCQQP